MVRDYVLIFFFLMSKKKSNVYVKGYELNKRSVSDKIEYIFDTNLKV